MSHRCNWPYEWFGKNKHVKLDLKGATCVGGSNLAAISDAF